MYHVAKVEDSFNKFMDQDLDANNFQNLTESSLYKDRILEISH